MNTTVTKYAVFEYLSGRANPLERQLVEDWLMNKDNEETFHQWLLEFEVRSPQFVPEQERAITALLGRLESTPDPQIPLNVDLTEKSVRYQGNNHFWLIAASVILLMGCGWWFREPLRYKTYQTAYGQTTDIYLEDGSKVALNSNSILKVPRLGFDKGVREVLLQGEAEFMVSHTIDHKRFVVKTSDSFQVEVLGTTFSVFARPRGTKVALTSGSVRIGYSHNEQKKEVMLVPGDLASLDARGAVQLERKQDVKTFASWKEQRYVFNATPVKDIIAMMDENFGRRVILADSNIAQRTITGNFRTRNADELLKTISEVLDMKIEQQSDSFLLTTN